MASNPEAVRQAALKEMARRELARRQQKPFVGPNLFDARTNPQDYESVTPALSGAPRAPVPMPGASKEAYAQFLEQMRNYKDPKGTLTTGGEFRDFAAGMGKATTDLWLGAKQMVGGASFEDAARKRATDAPLMATPAGRVGQFAGNVAAAVPAAFVPGANTVVGGAILGGSLGALQPTEASGDRMINTAVGATLGGATNYIGNRVFNPRTANRAPSIDEIKIAKDAAYRAADASPDVVPLSRIGEVIPKVERMLRDEGFRPALHPSAKESLSALYEEATQPGVYGQTLKGVEGLRRQLMQAQLAATNRADAMMAGRVLDEFDDVLDELVPYGEARSLYHTLRKAQDIEVLFERAQNAAGGYQQSGFENALRIQFRQLADNAKRFNRFNAAEREAILKVVRGGPLQSIIRFFGKFAPRGPVSSMATGMLGNAIGGPAGAAALGGFGEGAKFASGQMRTAAAENVSELVRSGALRSVSPAAAAPVSRLPAAATTAVTAPAVNYLSTQERARRNALAR